MRLKKRTLTSPRLSWSCRSTTSMPTITRGLRGRPPNKVMPGTRPGMRLGKRGIVALVCRFAVDHVFELTIFLAGGVPANQLHLLQIVQRLEPVTLLHLPHAVI